jgi:serine/threonine protein phosphatase PrpC
VVGAPQGAAPEISDKAGCCALVVLLKGTTLYVANVGDSRVVRRAHPCARASPLSTFVQELSFRSPSSPPRYVMFG